ncbi:hypothetical protein PV327_003855 [Microctonus hyperodae]|uniref:Peptidase M12B domain-containing protein n=1 Tax=Microctonus hyperodae TaxID=165561 RepID=A0AA39G4W3_MICHY|nr:hypothetical protein PV327_003855 [Microctonus hyperodae]
MHWPAIVHVAIFLFIGINNVTLSFTQSQQSWIKGIFSGEKSINDRHRIVVPRKVTYNGTLMSHNVTHYHDNDSALLHYRLEMSGMEYHLQLIPSNDFIGPGMVVERRKRDIHVRYTARERSSKCHYRGFIRGHVNSLVALSACDGLAGVLRGDHGEFWLEPVTMDKTGEGNGTRTGKQVVVGRYAYATNASLASTGRPHLVFRRSAAVDIGAGQRRRRKKKKKKYERNCGTREPRRLSETRLEWQNQSGLVQVQGRGRRKHRWQRSKRSISRPRHVEALVVADTSMMAFHQDGDVETYLLTIMNMVSALYHDPTIGNFINVVVVRIILMEEDEAEQGLNITVNADKTLYNFCKWQLKLNPGDDSHPNHHDVAILVTREDICSRANTPCSTLGVAHVAGMCQPNRSCSVNEDNGITLAHTITHELGHNFGMYHDTDKIGCSKRDGDMLHVMTPTFEVDTVGVAWSRCSQRDITNFLDQGKGECLEDEPADNDYAYPDLPPGAMYNAEHQCRLQFGVREASVCSPLHEICSKLWCIVDGSCTTMLHPAAPGTHCDEPCELYCTDTNESVIVPWGESAFDGTPCNVGTRDMCIAGICRKVGCDWMVDSDASEDRCGICHGDGTQCETTSGIYDKNEGPGYREVIIIPAGSRNIKIEELGNSKNYIGIGVPNENKYFLNGKRQITLAGEYEVAGTPALYERDHDKEKVRIPGPIKEDIVVYLIYRGHYRNFGLRYEYTEPKIEPDRAPEYSWMLSDWSLCTVTCGGGTQTSHALCHERKSGIVDDKFCDKKTKPEFVLRECNKNPCPARWWVGPWQMCPVICGVGALRKRSVMCVSSGKGPDRPDLALPDRECDKNEKPVEIGPCIDLLPCGPTSDIPLIVYADNKDTAFYNITNEQINIIGVDGNSTEEPEILEFDNVVDENPDNSMYNTKSKWLVSKWSHCIHGKRTRKVTCSLPGDCNLKSKPTSAEECRGEKWSTGKWGACNATCSTKFGVKKREVICKDRTTNVETGNCIPERRPLDTRRCHYRRQCGDEKLGCKDTIIPTSMCASYKRLCDISPIVREKCCATCSKRRQHTRHNRRNSGE